MTIIIAEEVATAQCMIISSEPPKTSKAKYNAGTITEPPLIPKRPALKPAMAPTNNNAKISGKY